MISICVKLLKTPWFTRGVKFWYRNEIVKYFYFLFLSTYKLDQNWIEVDWRVPCPFLNFFCDIHIWQIAQNPLIHIDLILIQFIITQKPVISNANWIKENQTVLSNLPYGTLSPGPIIDSWCVIYFQFSNGEKNMKEKGYCYENFTTRTEKLKMEKCFMCLLCVSGYSEYF